MLHYDTTGKGQPVLLVHGFGEDHRIWENTSKALESFFRLIIPHLPGTGQSPAAGKLSMESMAADILAIADREKLDRFHLVGHSMGGYISLAVAEAAPERLLSLTLFHSTAYPDSEEKKAARKKSIAFLQENGTAAFLQSTTANLFADKNKASMAATIDAIAKSNAYIDKNAMIAFVEAMMARKDRQEQLKTNAYPVLFLIGRYDQAVPYEPTMTLVHLPDISYIHVLQESGHMGMLEEPQTANQYLKDFLVQV